MPEIPNLSFTHRVVCPEARSPRVLKMAQCIFLHRLDGGAYRGNHQRKGFAMSSWRDRAGELYPARSARVLTESVPSEIDQKGSYREMARGAQALAWLRYRIIHGWRNPVSGIIIVSRHQRLTQKDIPGDVARGCSRGCTEILCLAHGILLIL